MCLSVVSTPDRLFVQRHPACDEPHQLHHDDALGWSVSRGNLLENRNIQCLIGYDPLEPVILKLNLFEAFGLIDTQTTVLLTPAILSLFSYTDLLADLCNCLPTSLFNLCFTKFGDDRLCRITSSTHTILLIQPVKILTLELDQKLGGRSV